MFSIVGLWGIFWCTNFIWKAREVFKKVLGARGSVLTKYEPVASHRGPVQTIFYDFRTDFQTFVYKVYITVGPFRKPWISSLLRSPRAVRHTIGSASTS